MKRYKEHLNLLFHVLYPKRKKVVELYFPSKKDFWTSLLIWGPILICLGIPFIDLESFFTLENLIAVIIIVVCVIPIAWMWFRTGYKIEDAKIKVQCGPFKWTVNIDDIQHIHKGKTFLSSPALSFDRLKVTYGKYNEICLSPKDEIYFLQLLIKENPRIQLDDRLSADVNSIDITN